MTEMENFGARLRKVRKELGLTQKEFVTPIGISGAYLSDMEKGKKFPSTPILQLMTVRHQINRTWLEKGKGPMFAWQQSSPSKETRLTPRQLEAQSHDGYAYLPSYKGQSDLNKPDEIVDSLAFKKSWLISEMRLNPADLYLLNVEDDSMAPCLSPGDLILVNHQESKVIRDGIYVVRLDGTLLIKRLQRLPGNQVKVSSQNKVYEPFTVDLDKQAGDFIIIGRVVWAGKKM
jgi:phage repressor protein C with HTH and peptisase S24 domain